MEKETHAPAASSDKERSRLPLQHPDYRYHSSRNPYWTKIKEAQGAVYSGNETEAHRGQWCSLFPASSPATPRPELHVEIGCNAGHVVVEWAALHPEHRYVGIDWKFKQIYRGFEKAQKRGLKNLMFFRAHAERLPFMFGPGEVDHLYLFFPDPWPRKSQWRNRFLNERNLRTIHGILRPGGIFHIKTDHDGYFEWMEEAVAKTAELWEVKDRTTDLHQGHPDPTALTIPKVTLFERLFIKDGIKIKAMNLLRK